jgi:hypothetical protein
MVSAPKLIRLNPVSARALRSSKLTVEGCASTVISALGLVGHVARILFRSVVRCSVERDVGVPPPK